jgi:hypothetical protein
MQSDGGIVDSGNQQAVDGENQRARWSTYMRSIGLIGRESGYKVAWIERVCQCIVTQTCASVGFRASTTRVELATCRF